MLFIKELLQTPWEEYGQIYRKNNSILPLPYESFEHNSEIILFKHQIIWNYMVDNSTLCVYVYGIVHVYKLIL